MLFMETNYNVPRSLCPKVSTLSPCLRCPLKEPIMGDSQSKDNFEKKNIHSGRQNRGTQAAYTLGPLSTHQQNAIRMAFCSLADGGPLVYVYWVLTWLLKRTSH